MSGNSRKWKTAVCAAAAGAAVLAGILGASAFFTDREETTRTIRVGTLSMEVQDLTDLDGNYRGYSLSEETGEVTSVDPITSGFQTNSFVPPQALDAQNPSSGIINPGDAGIYCLKVRNAGEKSLDAGATVRVRVALDAAATEPDRATPAALSAENTASRLYSLYETPGDDTTALVASIPLQVADRDAYTIEGLGRPQVTYAVEGDTKVMELLYCVDLGVLDGSAERDSKNVISQRAIAGMAGLSRLAGDKFMGARFTVTTEVFAKQHRNTFGTFASIDENGVLVPATGDWTGMASFERAVNQ